MSYQHIPNLYKDQDILMFKEVYVMEKVHGTSAHIGWTTSKDALGTETLIHLYFSSGGAKYQTFVDIFDQEALIEKIKMLDLPEVAIYGEAYGGKMQGMRDTYGSNLCFVVFDVKIGDCWLAVSDAEKIVNELNLEFIPYVVAKTDIDTLNSLRDSYSAIAVRRGCGADKKQEGIVIRPLINVIKNNGERICAKHKREDFQETRTPREIDSNKLEVLAKANEIADEWVTEMRLTHVLDKIPNHSIEDMGAIIKAMTEDVYREGKNEIVESREAKKAIARKTALMYKRRLQNSLKL